MTIKDLMEKAHANNQRRGIKGYDISDVIEKLQEEVHELKLAVTLGINAETWPYLGDYMVGKDESEIFKRHIHSSIQDELADIILVCMAASVELGIDIEWFLEKKNEYNAVRK